VKYAFIRARDREFGVRRMCEALCVSPSGYYGWRDRPEAKRSERDRGLLAEIRKVHEQSKQAYGAVKTWRALRMSGVACGKHRVARLRRSADIEARRKRKFRLAYQARQSAPAAPNLLRAPFHANRPDRVWVADITFVATRSGWLYLAVLLDLYSRRIVGWSMKDRPTQELVTEALKMAIEQRRPRPGLLHHSDQGIQYASGVYLQLIKRQGVVRSMSRKGNCYDNAVVESFFSSLKNELVHHRDYHSREEARSEIFDYIELFYNRRRMHQSLGYLSPIEYEKKNGVS
jgi:putative transposase